MKDESLYKLSEKLGPWVVRALSSTLRVEKYGYENYLELKKQGPLLHALYHGRMYLPVWLHRKQGVTALVSQSRDGEAVTRLVQALGYQAVRGSSHRGGREALKGMIQANQENRDTAIMVDGPRGPRYEPKMGTLFIARAAKSVILPTLGAAYPAWEFNSWDKFQLPKPFSKVVIGYGTPLEVPRHSKSDSLENLRKELKSNLMNLKNTIDEMVRS